LLSNPYVTFVTIEVRPSLEWVSVIWSPIDAAGIHSIESVQRYISLKELKDYISLLPYSQGLPVLKISSIEHRQIIADQSFFV